VSYSTSYRLGEIRRRLSPSVVHWFARLGSTNTRAAEMARSGALKPPALVLTGWQIAGRGRGTNTWWSSAGSLTVTFCFPCQPDRPAHHLPLIAGVSIRRTIDAIAHIPDLKLKWPNDLLHQGRKLAGLLCERVAACELVGLGLNVNLRAASAPPLLRNKITSLTEITGRHFDHTMLVAAIGEALGKDLAAATSLETVLAEYSKYDALHGQTVRVTDTDGSLLNGIAEGLDETGRLIVRSGRTAQHVIAGHVDAVTR
jgi:BirA family biotin operon repressor/biotin-[acetyl-CoA-carboxylase] ligase